jgi:single-strand DNA-binding protein
MSINNFISLSGVLGSDAEAVQKNGQTVVVKMSVATHEYKKDKATGELKRQSVWHDVQVFSPRLIEKAMNQAKKGAKIDLHGELGYNEFVTNNVKQKRAQVTADKFSITPKVEAAQNQQAQFNNQNPQQINQQNYAKPQQTNYQNRPY